MGGPFLVGALGIGVAALLVAVGLPATLFGRVPSVSGTLVAEPQRVAVVDGNTLRVQDKVVRLVGVRAPARGTECAPRTDCGAAAIAALAALVRGRQVVCKLDGRAADGFPQAMCEAAGTSINHALIASGYARAAAHDDVFGPDERRARTDRRGLWRDGSL
jgi:endonuclease YncB( thermonuclease family)